ncbi:MAG TPA: CarD family transcriptional regulator [Firmicutes bacterium]|jgi:CarD family transcriptional regulator|nr:CarD family transcriptional regulator [Bacillota bacterium]
MFNVGDRVVYPMHGAGIIEAVEEKDISGTVEKYYVIRLSMGEMKIMVPVSNVNLVGVREVIGKDEVVKVLDILKSKSAVMSSNWNRRYRANMEKIKSGNIYEVAEVVRNLSLRDREKGLSTGERKMLENARQILLSELVLAQNITEEQVEEMVEGCLN